MPYRLRYILIFQENRHVGIIKTYRGFIDWHF